MHPVHPLGRGHSEKIVGSASCVRRSCLGTCTGEPLAHVEPDDVRYSASSGEDLLRICERHALEGEPSPSRLATNRAELSTTAVPAPR